MPVSPTKQPDPGFAVYVHWPFCLSKCPYCDFNSHVRESVDQAQWRAALLAEIDVTANEIGDRRVRSIFFGGGTPSLMPPATVAAIINRIAARWTLEADAEISLEANPTSVEAEKLSGFAAAGVNRVSLGVQSMNDADLKFLGRGHSADEARTAVHVARKIFPRMSFDLIYARPNQTPAEWETELRAAIAMAADHLSLYQLTIEPGTGFEGAVKRGQFTPMQADLAADLYELTQEICGAHGLPSYEISNHARPGAESRHNLVYWRYGEYAGIGPGAHGRLHRDGKVYATANFRKPERWLEAGRETFETLGAHEQSVEMLMMGLRLRDGVSLARYQSLAQAPLPAARIVELCEDGLLLREGGVIKTTGRGRLLLDGVLARLLA
ncbi:MAG: coproporphyrinogen III oxidase [Alphaproteobacteria bacterium]|nr:coproporphyrinogen III oxidase [Alphaproteobacteria bacterium]